MERQMERCCRSSLCSDCRYEKEKKKSLLGSDQQSQHYWQVGKAKKWREREKKTRRTLRMRREEEEKARGHTLDCLRRVSRLARRLKKKKKKTKTYSREEEFGKTESSV